MPSLTLTANIGPLAVTMGDPAGIGGDVALTAWAQRRAANLPPFFMIDDPERLAALAKTLGLTIPIVEITTPHQAAPLFENTLPVMPLTLQKKSRPGLLDAGNAASVMLSLSRAVTLAQTGEVAAIITNPIHKQTLYASGFEHPGHTEYLAAETGGTPIMMLSCPGLRVVPVTIHVPLREVSAMLNPELIVSRGNILVHALKQDFGIDRPRVAVAALNPHGGESGALGSEEINVISPAVAHLQGNGLDVAGPFPADTLFHAEARGRYDAVLAMYHDQALIPLKTIDFHNGVNTTLGLPIVRTSPDHGTACDIAGSGKAHPGSFIAALRQAAFVAAQRASLS